MDPKRRKKLKERAARRSKLERPHVSQRILSAEGFNIHREVEYIVARAAERDARCVSLGPLVLFSTASGDAWILDPGDCLALCLARDGVPQPAHLEESATKFAIDWRGTFRIEGGTFTFSDHEMGQITTIIGYPTREIVDAIGQSSARKLK